MKSQKSSVVEFEKSFGIAAAISLGTYMAALWSEAAYHAAGIGFQEKLTWARMFEAYQVTTLSDVIHLELLPMGAVAVVGMIATIGVMFIPNLRPPTWGLGVYLLTLLLAGGWIGLLAVFLLPVHLGSLDGEFLDEMLARATACGVWTALVLGFFIHRTSNRWKSPSKSLLTIRFARTSV